MTRSSDLRDLQTLFWRLITAPEGIAEGARALSQAGDLPSPDTRFLVPDDDRLSSTERLDIYADMYFYRLHDCLLEDFPRLAATVGAGRFHNLVTDYLLAHPPAHFSLRELGRALPGFVTSHHLARSHPAAPGLARLEWARVDVFDEADAAPLSLDTLLAQAASTESDVGVALIPAARLLALDSEALRLWRNSGDADPGDGGRGPAIESIPVRVWRQGERVHHCSMEADEAAAMARLADGPAGLADLADAALAVAPAEASPEQAAERFAAMLAGWTRDAILTAVPPAAMR